jgi:hypothetical protein
MLFDQFMIGHSRILRHCPDAYAGSGFLNCRQRQLADVNQTLRNNHFALDQINQICASCQKIGPVRLAGC